MSSNLYVGNLSFDLGEKQIEELFTPYGEVLSVNVITDRNTGRPRGFGFVEMGQAEDAKKAIEALDGKEVEGRNLTVNVAKPKKENSGGGSGNGRRYNDRW
jgi:RNA recognition motif-containing protein